MITGLPVGSLDPAVVLALPCLRACGVRAVALGSAEFVRGGYSAEGLGLYEAWANGVPDDVVARFADWRVADAEFGEPVLLVCDDDGDWAPADPSVMAGWGWL